MKVYNVRFLQEALDDIEEIILYIARDSQASAMRMHDIIIDKANDLTTFPKRGRLVPDKKMSEAGYRMLGIRPYIAFYRVIDNDIFIYRVLHGTANFPSLYGKMAFEEDEMYHD